MKKLRSLIPVGRDVRQPSPSPLQIAGSSVWRALLCCAAMLAAGPAVAQEKKENAAESGATVQRFAVDGRDGAVELHWMGSGPVRAGQEYQYTLRIKNGSDVPVHNVVLHQTASGGFEVTKSQPKSARSPRSMQEPDVAQYEDAFFRAADAVSEGGSSESGADQPKAKRDKQPADNAAGANAKKNEAAEAQDLSGNRDASENRNAQRKTRKQQAGNAARQQARNAREEGSNPNRPAKTTWRLGMLKPQESRDVKITGLAGAEGTVRMCAWVAFQPTFCRDLEVVKPDLKLTREVLDSGKEPRENFFECEPVLVRYRLTNTGSGATPEATIQEDLPAALAVQEGGKRVELKVGRIEAGQTVERMVTLNAKKTGDFTSRATASAGDLKAQSESARIRIVRPELALQVEAPDQAYVGRSVTYRITVSNPSDAPALQTVVNMAPPEGSLRFTRSDRTIGDDDRYDLGRIDPGEEKSFSVSFDPSGVGEVGTTVTANAWCAEEKKQKIKTKIMGVPAVQISVVDRADPIKSSETTVYEVKVLNEGTADDMKIALTGKLPGHLEFVEGRGDSEINGNGQEVKFADVERLSPGNAASWYVTVKGKKSGRGQFRVTMQTETTSGEVVSSEPTTVF